MQDLSPYAGRWVALIGEEVVGVGYTATDALVLARRNRPRDRFALHYVEGDSGRPLILSPLMEQLRPLLTRIEQPIYLVGGAVRDALLGQPSNDLDFVLPQDAVKWTFRIANQLHLPAYVLDKERDAGRIVIQKADTYLDFTRFRGADLEADLQDRDFTINAIAMPANAVMSGSLIDPCGGQADLEAGLIRLAHERALLDDPVRALRAVRLATRLRFSLTSETETAVIQAAPNLNQVSAERIRDELLKMMEGDTPQTAVQAMVQYELLDQVLPEVAQLKDVAQSAPHHEPVLAHTISVLDWLTKIEVAVETAVIPDDSISRFLHQFLHPFNNEIEQHWQQTVDGGIDGRTLLRLGALFHDVGKRQTQTVDAENGRIRFIGHEKVGATIASARLHKLCISNQAINQIKKIVSGHMRPLLLASSPNLTRRAVYRFFRATGTVGVDIAILSLADHLATYDGTGPMETWENLCTVVQTLLEHYFQRYEETVAPTPLINGRELIEQLHLTPGPEVGRLLRLIEEAHAAGEIHTKEEALLLASNARQ